MPTKSSCYKITVTFPDDIFGENFGESSKKPDVMKALGIYLRHVANKATVHPERGTNGRYHLEGIMELKKPNISGNIKRDIMTALGVNRAAQMAMSPQKKAHFVVVKIVNYLPGAMNYVIKEQQDPVIRFGYDPTFIAEQAAIGAEQHAIRLSSRENTVFITDSNIFARVTQYATENSLDLINPRTIIKAMMRENYNFTRVRNGKYFVAHWDMIHNNNEAEADAYLASWTSNVYHLE